MLAYAGKCLGELTGKVLQNAICIVFYFLCECPPLLPQSGFDTPRGAWFGFLLYGKLMSERENQMKKGVVYMFSIAKLYSA